ncbi:hypothetical protein DL93DRAFT_2073781 [Clavulina sp. PMI_390]|nr:hypothetical protein DL93DRAFT_2073781 [Clavulina sp. PMI_390]
MRRGVIVIVGRGFRGRASIYYRQIHTRPSPRPCPDVASQFPVTQTRHDAVRVFRGSEERRTPESQSVPDDEWEMRVGRGIYVLTSTLPNFFDSGLVVNASHDSDSLEDIPIYSKMVELSYTPPAALPSPLPQTLRINGLTMYQGSASMLKSTFTALYSDCSVTLERMSVIPGGFRERKVKIDLGLQGTARLTNTKAEWNVLSTYSFSPTSGLISRHEIERIYPEPHSALIDSVRATILRLMGIKGLDNPNPPIGGLHTTPCTLDSHAGKPEDIQ